MTDREKLIELIGNIQQHGHMERRDANSIWVSFSNNKTLADYLIANGVTFATDTNVPSKWISVEDRMPDENHDWVLVICRFVPEGGYGVPHVAELRGGVWYADCYDGPIEEGGVKVTHWMPLPEPPKEE